METISRLAMFQIELYNIGVQNVPLHQLIYPLAGPVSVKPADQDISASQVQLLPVAVFIVKARSPIIIVNYSSAASP